MWEDVADNMPLMFLRPGFLLTFPLLLALHVICIHLPPHNWLLTRWPLTRWLLTHWRLTPSLHVTCTHVTQTVPAPRALCSAEARFMRGGMRGAGGQVITCRVRQSPHPREAGDQECAFLIPLPAGSQECANRSCGRLVQHLRFGSLGL